MKKWFNKLVQRLQGDEGIAPLDSDNESTYPRAQEPDRTQATTRNATASNPANAMELREMALKKAIDACRVLSSSQVRVSAIVFHVGLSAGSASGVAADVLFNAEEFRIDLLNELRRLDLRLTRQFAIRVEHDSAESQRMSAITSDIGLEVITEKVQRARARATISALTGFLWEDRYVLQAEAERPYQVGRCRTPRLDNGYVITNDIAFVGPEEDSDPKYAINAHVGRAMAQIFWDDDKGAFVIRRSSYGGTSAVKLKVISVGFRGMEETPLHHASSEIALCDGDQIVFNDQVSILFQLLKSESDA